MNRRPRKSLSMPFIAALLCILPLAGTGCGRSAEAVGEDQPAKKIVMALDGVFDHLERAPVLFDHELHTKALKESGCRTCHDPNEKGKMNYEFASWDEAADERAIIDANHEKCMACHGGDATGSEEARELTCGECHTKGIEYSAFKWYRATFSHANHIDLMEKGCDTCHHKYDEQTGESIYEKGDEAACGSCHKQEDDGKKAALRKAGHIQCIGCHEEKYPNTERKADPYDCGGCHKPEEKPAAVERVVLAARPYEKRPTNLLLSYPGSIMPAVPFDHKKHVPEEEDSCAKSCHQFHARTLARFDTGFARSGDACQQCHLLADTKIMSGGVNADKVYHDPESPDSCRGCHIKENKKVEKEEEKSPETCKGCHTGGETLAQAVEVFDLEAQPEGPETHVISRLSRKRLPVKFPHAQHAKMVENCKVCHHESPEKEIPTCYACHGASADFEKKAKLKLVGAYHRMCIGCHRDMGSGPIACNKCHEEKEVLHSPGRALQTSETLN